MHYRVVVAFRWKCLYGDIQKELPDRIVGELVKLGIINQVDVLFTHLDFEKYANLIFTEPIYEARKTVRDYLASIGIETIGRFCEWDYLWGHQSLMSGLDNNCDNGVTC